MYEKNAKATVMLVVLSALHYLTLKKADDDNGKWWLLDEIDTCPMCTIHIIMIHWLRI